MTVKEYEAKSAKEKVHGAKCGGNKVQTPESALPVESHRIYLIPSASNCDTCVQCYLPGKLIRDGAPKVFFGGGWSSRHPCLACTTLLDSPEESMCLAQATLHSLGVESHSYQRRMGTFPKPSFLTPSKGQSCKQVFLSLAASDLLCLLLSAWTHTTSAHISLDRAGHMAKSDSRPVRMYNPIFLNNSISYRLLPIDPLNETT